MESTSSAQSEFRRLSRIPTTAGRGRMAWRLDEFGQGCRSPLADWNVAGRASWQIRMCAKMFRYLPFFEQSQLPMWCFALSGCTSFLGMDYQAISGELVRGFVRPAARTSRASNRAARAGAVPRPPASASAWRASCPRLACTGPAQPAIQPPLSAASCKHPARQTAIASNINY